MTLRHWLGLPLFLPPYAMVGIQGICMSARHKAATFITLPRHELIITLRLMLHITQATTACQPVTDITPQYHAANADID